MCYRPIRIINNSHHFNCECDKVYNVVPCGECGQCRSKKQLDFEARVYYEYLNCIKNGGFVFFQSFTYNEDEVPYCHGIKCFDSRHYVLYMKNLRNDFERFGIERDAVKVFWTCEYGGNTFRPHYHALFFVYAKISVDDFCKLTERNWCRINYLAGKVNQFEYSRIPLGYCDTNNPDPRRRHTPESRVVNAQGALSYVSKYVCKDIDFEKVLKNQKGGNFDGEPLSEDDKKYMMPFHRQSKHLGDCIKDMVNIDQLMKGRISIPDSKQGVKFVSLPQYVDRKIFYDYNKDDKCFYLNELGKKMKSVRYTQNASYVKQQIEFIINNIDSLWTSHCQKKLLRSLDDAKIDIHTIYDSRKADFIDYILVFKDRIDYYSDYINSSKDLSGLKDYLLKSSYDKDLSKISYSPYLFKDGREFHLYNRTYYQADRFDRFEELITILNTINRCYCDDIQLQYLKNQEEKARQKSMYNSLYRM